MAIPSSGQSIGTSEPGVQRVFNSKSETQAFYNKIAKVYDLLAEHSEEPVRLAGLAKFAAQPAENVLEIGFGTGHCLIALAKAVAPHGKAHGVDTSEEMVTLTRHLAEHALPTRFSSADSQRAGIDDQFREDAED